MSSCPYINAFFHILDMGVVEHAKNCSRWSFTSIVSGRKPVSLQLECLCEAFEDPHAELVTEILEIHDCLAVVLEGGRHWLLKLSVYVFSDIERPQPY